MSDEDIEKIAREIWEDIRAAYHWGDGFTSAYHRLVKNLKKVRDASN